MALNRAGVASLVVLAAALVLACGSSEADRFEEQWALLGVPEAEFVFLGDLTSDEEESIRRELKAAQVVLAEHFGAVTSDFTVYVSTDLDLLNERLAVDRPDIPSARSTCAGFAPRKALLLVLEDCGDELRARGGPVAHEYFHILQWDAGRLQTPSNNWTTWLAEGSAVYASALVNEAQGRKRTRATWREGALLAWSGLGQEFPGGSGLSEEESRAQIYGVGFLAADWLVERAGPEALLEVFRLGSHEHAFRNAFGMSVRSFYSAFEKFRLEAAPPFEWGVGGTVLDADGAPAGDMHLFNVVRIEGEAWSVGLRETDPQGHFEYAAPANGYTISVWLQCPRDDGIEGRLVYVGEFGAGGFVAAADGFLKTDEEGAEPFTDGERDRTDLVIELPETRESLIAKHCES